MLLLRVSGVAAKWAPASESTKLCDLAQLRINAGVGYGRPGTKIRPSSSAEWQNVPPTFITSKPTTMQLPLPTCLAHFTTSSMNRPSPWWPFRFVDPAPEFLPELPIFFSQILVVGKSCRWTFDDFLAFLRVNDVESNDFSFVAFTFSLAASLQMFCVTDEKSSLLLAERAESHLTCLAKQHSK